jgi:WD40 repeat protein
MASSNFHRFSHGHNDLVLAIDYNFYGTRMATASSDHRLKVWDRNDSTNQWTVTDVWTAHDAEVTDVKWNGPFVGTHLASIGEDGLLKIWEEDVNEAPNTARRFKKVFEQVTATGAPYQSLDFKNVGTESYLAVITRDGYLAVSEPEDHDDLSSWRIMWSDYLCKTPSRTEETGFRVCWHREKLPQWPAILSGLDRRSLSLAVSVGDVVKVFRTDKDRKFYTAAVLEGANSLIRDVSWANGSMRGFDIIATASKDGLVRIYELHTPGASNLSTLSNAQSSGQNGVQSNSNSNRPARSGIGAGLAGGSRGKRDENAGAPGAVKQDTKLVAELKGHQGAPWRVSWSDMGDTLVSTGDDGTVKLWKKAVDGKWLEATEIDATKDA